MDIVAAVRGAEDTSCEVMEDAVCIKGFWVSDGALRIGSVTAADCCGAGANASWGTLRQKVAMKNWRVWRGMAGRQTEETRAHFENLSADIDRGI